jgi:hypothetical protein
MRTYLERAKKIMDEKKDELCRNARIRKRNNGDQGPIHLDSVKFTFSPPEKIVRLIAKKESRRCQL